MISENLFEKNSVDWFNEGGYEYVNGYDVALYDDAPVASGADDENLLP